MDVGMQNGNIAHMQDTTAKAEQVLTKPVQRIRLPVVFLISVVVVILAGFAVSNELFGRSTGISMINVPAGSGILTIVLLLLFNALFRTSKMKKIQISSGELVLIYTVIAVASLLLHQGLLMFFVFAPTGLQKLVLERFDPPVYEPLYEEMSSLVLPKSTSAIMGFYRGGAIVPWAEWIVPMILWSMFFLAFILVIMCTTSFLVHFWNDVEHLPYPVANAIGEMVFIGTGEDSTDSSIWANKIARMGMALSGVWVLSHILNTYVPFIPAIPYRISYEGLISRSEILQSMTWYYVWGFGIPLHPAVIGLSFLVQLDVLFSIWFVWLLQCIAGYLNFYFRGANMNNMFAIWPDQIRLGGLLGMGIVSIWLARHEIARISRLALSRSGYAQDDYTMSPVLSLFGLLLGFVFLVAFCSVFIKMNPVIAIVFFVVAIIGPTLALARVRAEAGVPSNCNPTASFLETGLFQAILGTDVLGSANIFKFQYVMPISYGHIGGVMPIAMEGYKMADDVKIKRVYVTYAVLFAAGIALIVGWPILLSSVYHNGAFMADAWVVRTGGTQASVNSTEGLGATLSNPNIVPALVLIGSTLVTVLLMVLRAQFMWWPIHPIGYAMSLNGWLLSMYLTFFIVWFLKLLIIRYGSIHLYRTLKPFGIGMVIGYAVMEAIGGLIGVIAAL